MYLPPSVREQTEALSHEYPSSVVPINTDQHQLQRMASFRKSLIHVSFNYTFLLAFCFCSATSSFFSFLFLIFGYCFLPSARKHRFAHLSSHRVASRFPHSYRLTLYSCIGKHDDEEQEARLTVKCVCVCVGPAFCSVPTFLPDRQSGFSSYCVCDHGDELPCLNFF
jgi:hypothetical protein